MSPYDERYVDIKFTGEVSGSVSIGIEEGSLSLSHPYSFLR